MNKLKKGKMEKGITLVALIITIIVLLILAVVAIGAVQNNGIIEHAKNARDKYQSAQNNENVQLQNYLDILNENTPNGSDLVFASITPENYGDTIEYSAGNVDEWKVFYKDDTHLYIITSDYLKRTNLPTGLNINNYDDDSYEAIWNGFTASKASDAITTQIANKYKLSWFNDTTKDSTDENARATADLLNTTVWTEKFGNAEKGIEAIGAPTLEMWVASWNAKGTAKNTAETTKYEPLKTEYNSTGYFVGPTTTQNLAEIAEDYDSSLGGYSYNVGNSTYGYADKLYFPHNSEVEYTCAGYWLASTSAHHPISCLVTVNYDGAFNYSDPFAMAFQFCAARPVVSLPYNVITLNADGGLKVVQ